MTNSSIDIGILDFGQTKRLQSRDRLAFARLVDAIARKHAVDVRQALTMLGIEVVRPPAKVPRRRKRRKGNKSATLPAPDSGLTPEEQLAYTMFDTAAVPGVSDNPFHDDSALRSATVESFPQDLFFLLRTVQILKGICAATSNSDFSLASAWAPAARKALRAAGS